VNDGQAHRVAVVRQGTVLRLYVDGVLDGTSTTAGVVNISNATSLKAGTSICVGSGDNTQAFTGLLDELALTTRAKTGTELAPYTDQAGAAYVYDALSRRTSVSLTNGTVTSYSYDAASQVTAISHQLAATSALINQAAYTYNAVGNRTSLTDRRGPQAFGYDNLDRLISASHPLLATPQAFAYDPVGNRTTNGSLHNAGNQLTADAAHTYSYDANGNLTRKTLTANGNYTQYTYDAENRLIQVQEFAAGSSMPIATSTYRYDGLGRRIEKVANGQTKRYIYDGEDILLEYDGTNTLVARYTHGPGIDEPIAVTKGGSTFFYHQDGLGTVTDLTDSGGAPAKSYAYDAYGNILESPGALDQPYTYTGREIDAETGLYYYRARSYDPRTGRFLQKDPIGLVGGGNLYRYVGSNPVLLSDSLGLCPGDRKKCIDDFLRNLYGDWAADLLVHHFSLASAFLDDWRQVALTGAESLGAKASLAAAAYGVGESLIAKETEILSRPAAEFSRYFGIIARAESAAASVSLGKAIINHTARSIAGLGIVGSAATIAATGIHLQAYQECADKDP
jgi:RHS repeat-associated protein